MFWRFWVKTEDKDIKKTKLELAQQMLLDLRRVCRERLWLAIDRWFLCSNFFTWLVEQNFDWVTKAKKNTILYCKYFDPVSRKEKYRKVNPKALLREVYAKLCLLGKGGIISIPEIYLKLPYETTNRKGKPMRRWRYVPIAAVTSTYHKEPVKVGRYSIGRRGRRYLPAYLPFAQQPV